MGEPNLFSNPNAYEEWVMRQREANNAAARNAGKVPISLRNKIGKGLSKLGNFIGWGSRKNKNYKP